jgi:hypothetical protein
VWAVRFWLDREQRLRDRALFDLAIDSKLPGCDVVKRHADSHVQFAIVFGERFAKVSH